MTELAGRLGPDKVKLGVCCTLWWNDDFPTIDADIPFAQVDLFLQVRAQQRPKSDLAQLDPQKIRYLASVMRRNRFKRKLPLCAPPWLVAHGPA